MNCVRWLVALIVALPLAGCQKQQPPADQPSADKRPAAVDTAPADSSKPAVTEIVPSPAPEVKLEDKEKKPDSEPASEPAPEPKSSTEK
jgi:hypothetical protein